ncbi:hypothetical protein BST13_21320 [Mycobacterium aquaticum]|uniref:DUF1206 domain-containing protein n=1 Tax=Mycobacterium aquaticum TaxID=1927124 RepID=A0A1X0AS60_9MYCO|nr:hypothetical protein BST13_21320 [Mycobacterium aquaticum]
MRSATTHPVARVAARAGYVISGILHLLIGDITFRIATGSGGEADQNGALKTIADTTWGSVALWVTAAALAPLILWRLAETILGLHPSERRDNPEDREIGNRLKALGLAVVYTAVAATAVQYAVGSGKSGAVQNAGLSARLMHSPQGKAVLVVSGVVIVVIGSYYAFKGASRRFCRDLTVSPGRVVTVMGLSGYVAEGLTLAGAGALVIVAAVRADPSKATGLDGAVKTLAQLPYGTVLILCAALGFVAYGCYSLVLSRYARM